MPEKAPHTQPATNCPKVIIKLLQTTVKKVIEVFVLCKNDKVKERLQSGGPEGIITGIFFYTFEKTQGEKNLNFSAFGRKLKPYIFKNPKLLEILST